jgi:hypothetical protein
MSPFKNIKSPFKNIKSPFKRNNMLLPIHSVPTATKKMESSLPRNGMQMRLFILLAAVLVLLPIAGAAPWGTNALVGDREDFGMGPPMCQKRPERRLRKMYEEEDADV